MKKITLFLSIFILFGCSNERGTFSLVCKGKNTIETLKNYSVDTSKVVDEMRTYFFEDKKLKNYKCNEFTDKQISCSYEYHSPDSDTLQTDYLYINRISGEVSDQYNYKKGLNQHDHTWFKGICEKSTNKI